MRSPSAPDGVTAITTSHRAWVWRTTSSATARPPEGELQQFLHPANNESNFIQANPGVAADHDDADVDDTATASPMRARELGENRSADPGERQLRKPPQHDPRQPADHERMAHGRSTGSRCGIRRRSLPRFSVDVAFNRRCGVIFYVTDNQLSVPTISTGVTITAPTSTGAALPQQGSRSRS